MQASSCSRVREENKETWLKRDIKKKLQYYAIFKKVDVGNKAIHVNADECR